MNTRAILMMWCSNGFEFFHDITDEDPEVLDRINFERKLRGESLKEGGDLDRLIGRLRMRAQFNTDRYYEIYAIRINEDCVEDFREMSEKTPQALVDLVREKGVKIYGEPRSKSVSTIV